MTPTQSPTNPHAAGKAAHSPLPWRVNGNHIEARPDPENSDTYWAEVAYLDTEWFERITEANAQFIVRACNSHAALVEAVERLLNQVTGPAQVYGDGIGRDGHKTGLSHWEFNELRDERIAFARAALSSATLEATP